MSELAWHDPCPHCETELAYVHNGVTYSRKIGMEYRGVYDGVLHWSCPICGWAWHRCHRCEHPGMDSLRDKAEPYLRDIQNTVLEAELLNE